MTVSSVNWRFWIRGLAVNDMIISFIGILFCACCLPYLYDLGPLKDSKGSLHWAIFVALFVYIFVLMIQLWLSFMLLKDTSVGEEKSVTVTRPKLWRDFNLFHIGCYTLFFCLEFLWAPDAVIFKLLIIALICYRLACYATAHFFIKYQHVQQKEIVAPEIPEANVI